MGVSYVGAEGIGPSTSVLSGQRSTTELRARAYNLSKTILNFTRYFHKMQGAGFVAHIYKAL